MFQNFSLSLIYSCLCSLYGYDLGSFDMTFSKSCNILQCNLRVPAVVILKEMASKAV